MASMSLSPGNPLPLFRAFRRWWQNPSKPGSVITAWAGRDLTRTDSFRPSLTNLRKSSSDRWISRNLSALLSPPAHRSLHIRPNSLRMQLVSADRLRTLLPTLLQIGKSRHHIEKRRQQTPEDPERAYCSQAAQGRILGRNQHRKTSKSSKPTDEQRLQDVNQVLAKVAFSPAHYQKLNAVINANSQHQRKSERIQ